MHNRTLSTAAAVSAALLALTACTNNDDEADSQEPAPTTENTAPPAADASEQQAGPELDEALQLLDTSQPGAVTGPNGENWDLVGSLDPEILSEHMSGTLNTNDTTIPCDQSDLVRYVWLSSDEEGPACFGEDGGHDNLNGGRLIDHACQAPNTTARALVIPLDEEDGGTTVWTPEHTTGNSWECLDFDGAEVVGVQVQFLDETA